MPNHLHFVYVQAESPLTTTLQPLLRRIAILLQKTCSLEGHAFERRYRAYPCGDPDYLRNAIAYTHLNPVRAGLCRNPEDYEWTSHREYVRCIDGPARRGREEGIRLFSTDGSADYDDVRADYRAFLAWRMDRDLLASIIGAGSPVGLPNVPECRAGDEYWAGLYGWSCMMGGTHERPRVPGLELRDLARKFVRADANDLPLATLRSGRHTRAIVDVRRRFIRWARQYGHTNRAIAAFLNISEPAVSQAGSHH